MRMKVRPNARRMRKVLVVSAGLFILLASSAAHLSAQGKLNLEQIRALPGEEIGRGSNKSPVTDLKLYTYRVESLKLPQRVRVKIAGKKEGVDKAWRITISGEHFVVGAMPAVLLIDNEPAAIGMENRDQTELSFIVFNPRLIRSGATLGVTYGGDLLIDSRDPELVTADFTLPRVDDARKHLLPEPMTIREK
jgi:hypothetical protein